MPQQRTCRQMTPRLVILTGLPASGKSTWASEQAAAVLSSDHLRWMLVDDEADQTVHRPVFATLRFLLRKRLELRRPLTLVDATNLTPQERRPYIRTAQMYGCRVESVYFDTSVEICKARNRARSRVVPEEVLDLLAAKLVVPTLIEGFDSVMHVQA
jgi:predicted kinase